ncbi:hypothetical protein HanXRQr2_Chr15g0713741 [Helianthus annuus]|uniref:Uncharacterized protein n=1 Tax=Helianthus annuus TaxID=4232 RepID=A0A9K3H681_HELAN|nr:hypothetical protein HanXRQr2_Chr15g0713741 [Helianthus annuus]KAJ0832978.1 hypothetical protein HanPSC8_Chr15g0684941 [Helianthus annuus]
MSHARCLYNRVYRKTKAEKRSALLRPIQGVSDQSRLERKRNKHTHTSRK